MKIGCFELMELSPGKWWVRNTLTGIEHRTYGTEEELIPLLTTQTALWEAKFEERNRKLHKGRAMARMHNQSHILHRAKKAATQ